MVAFYKHDIPRWMDGTETLSDGAYRTYHVICQLIYLQEGPIVLNERGIAGRCNQRRDRFRRYLKELVSANKLHIVDGKIENVRAAAELAKINKRRNGVDSDHSGVGNGTVEVCNGSVEPNNPLKSLEPKEQNPPLDKTLEDKNNPPRPPSGGEVSFADFWERWEVKSDAGPPAERVWNKLTVADRAAAFARVPGYFAETRKFGRDPTTAKKYLTDRHWEGLTQAGAVAPRKPSEPQLINRKDNPQEWEAWKHHYIIRKRAGDLEARRQLILMEAREPNNTFVRVPSELPPNPNGPDDR